MLRRPPPVLAFGILLLGTILLQMWCGAYRTERGNSPDEAAHFMNGLLVRDYLREGLGSNPMQFARQYYLNYPKIAPGMWPPLYHGLLGLFLLPGWSPQTAALLLVGLATAWTAWRLFRILSVLTTPPLALVLAMLFLCTPVIVSLSSAVMLDMVVAAFALEATFWLARFFDSGRRLHGVLFGIFAAGACLTKGNGLAIFLCQGCCWCSPDALICCDGLACTGRRRSYIVGAAPLVSATVYLDASIGDFGPISWFQIIKRTGFYSHYLVEQLGFAMLVVAGAGLLTGFRPPRVSSDQEGSALVPGLSALVLSALLFHLLNPHKVMDGRYMTLAVAPIFGLLPVGVHACLGLVRRTNWHDAPHGGLTAALSLSAILIAPRVQLQALGFRDATNFIEAQGGLAGRRMIVVSEENGEGAFVAEVASRHPEPRAIVFRASKIMASGTWTDPHLELSLRSSTALIQELEDLHVEYIVVDRSLEASGHELWKPIEDLVAEQASRLAQVYWSHALGRSSCIDCYISHRVRPRCRR